MTRGFEVVSAFAGQDIHLPVRKTEKSAGYDMESAADVDLLPGKVTVIPTGVKAYMGAGEYLSIHIRSSMGLKHGIMLANSTGIIDADYYNNPDNEGHIMVALLNMTDKVFHVNKGDRIAQGIFTAYLKADDDNASGKREGGIGSTGA